MDGWLRHKHLFGCNFISMPPTRSWCIWSLLVKGYPMWKEEHCNDVIFRVDGVSNHQPHDGLLSRLFRHRSKKTSKLRVTGLCEGNSPVTSEFPSQRASNAENGSIWWRHHENRPQTDCSSNHLRGTTEYNWYWQAAFYIVIDITGKSN